MSDRLPRAVTYARVSTQEQADKGISIETQEHLCLRKAAEIGAVVVGQFQDAGVSGALYKARPGLQAALAAIERGEADTLVIAKLDRLSRDTAATLDVQDRIENAGALLVSCDGLRMGSDAASRLTTTMFAGVATFERARIGERVSEVSQRLAERGVQPARGQAPYGYLLVTRDSTLRGEYPAEMIGRYVVKEPEASIVREMFLSYSGGHASMHGLARQMISRGVPTPRGGAAWSATAIRSMLSNPAYKGKARWGSTKARVDEDRQARGLKVKYRTQRSEPLVSIDVDPLVSEAVWQECQERMQTNRQTRSGNPTRAFMLASLARCPVCGRGMTGVRNAAKEPKRYYRCNRAIGTRHKLTLYDAEIIDALTLRAFELAAAEPYSIEAAFVAKKRRAAARQDLPDVEMLREQLAEVVRREHITARAQVDALISGTSTDAYRPLLKECAERRAALEERLAEAERRQQAEKSDDCEPATVAELLQAMVRVLHREGRTDAEKRAILQTVVREVIPVDRDRVRVRIRGNETVHDWFLSLTVSGEFEVTVEDTCLSRAA